MKTKETVALPKTYTKCQHRCGEVIYMVDKGGMIVGYTDISKVTVVVCPHCLKDIEYEDLQLPENIANLGWPN
jgi:hypothetical protein